MKLIFLKRSRFWAFLILSVFGLGYLIGFWAAGTLPVIGRLNRKMPIFYVKKEAAEVCLTFDISWGTKTLPEVLRILEENQVPATFFCSGPWGVTQSAALKSIEEHGHEIASHGDRHVNLSQHSKEEVERNLLKARGDLLTVIKDLAPYFRPPNGDYNDMVIDTARELGFETVIWAVDSLDWLNPGPEVMVKRILSRVFPGAILLFHASDSSKQIQLALPEIIKGLRAKGLKPVQLSRLMENGTPGRNDPR